MGRGCEVWKAAVALIADARGASLDTRAALKAETEERGPLEKTRFAGAAAKAWRRIWGRNAVAIVWVL